MTLYSKIKYRCSPKERVNHSAPVEADLRLWSSKFWLKLNKAVIETMISKFSTVWKRSPSPGGEGRGEGELD